MTSPSVGRWRAAAVWTLLILASRVPAQPAQMRFDGSSTNDELGITVAWAGDVDGDGTADVIAGANIGHYVRIYSGRTGSLIHDFPGGPQFGRYVAGLGDVNGDGRSDVAISGPVTPEVRSGLDGTVLHTLSAWPPTQSVASMASAGDVDGDGRCDVVVGLSGDRVAILSGSTGALIRTIYGTPNTNFGSSVGCAGDIDGDGRSEVVVGAPTTNNGSSTHAGAAHVFSGATGNEILLGAIRGVAALEYFGRAVGEAGDVSGDAVPDLIVGSSNGGVARVYSGANGFRLFELFGAGGAGTGSFGEAVGGIGDLDRDGRSDFAVGAPGESSGPNAWGTVRIYSGRDASVLATFRGQSGISMMFGCALASAADLNGDGTADLIVGEREASHSAYYSGSVHVYFLGVRHFLTATLPVRIGTNLTLWYLNSTPNAPVWVLADLQTGAIPLGPNGLYGTTQLAFSPYLVALADPVGQFGPGIAPPFTSPTGQWIASIPIPSDPALLGVSVYCEAYTLDFFAPHFIWQSNLLTLHFQ